MKNLVMISMIVLLAASGAVPGRALGDTPFGQHTGEMSLKAEDIPALRAKLLELRKGLRAGGLRGAPGLPGGEYLNNYHYEHINCSDCHTMHYSAQHDYSGGPPPALGAGGPFEYLLKAQTVAELCLLCHDGAQGIPDVRDEDVNNPGEVYNGTERCAGRFIGDLGGPDNWRGHNLPGQGSFDMGECYWCHDPHGNTNYRNLMNWFENPLFYEAYVNPAASGLDIYHRQNVGYAEGISDWFCSVCHGLGTPYNTRSPNPPAHFERHPSSREDDIIVLNGIEHGDPYHTDPAHWAAGTGAGFDQGVGRVPFAVHTATNFAQATVVAQDNEVFCLSCHKAHGSINAFGVLWPYGSGGPQPLSSAGCQQCHNVQ